MVVESIFWLSISQAATPTYTLAGGIARGEAVKHLGYLDLFQRPWKWSLVTGSTSGNPAEEGSLVLRSWKWSLVTGSTSGAASRGSIHPTCDFQCAA